MSISNLVSVNTHYTRSVHLERDLNSVDLVKSYTLTSTALQILEQMSNSFHDRQAPRAWSLIGPYGTGKSVFSIFLTQLLSSANSLATKSAEKILMQENPKLAKKYMTEKRGGYLPILLTGSPVSLKKSLLEAIKTAAINYGFKKQTTWIKNIERDIEKNNITIPSVMAYIKTLQGRLIRKNCGGIIIVIDELGKFLEYEARHAESSDIYLLQTLAEYACQGNKVNLLLAVVLHQSFEQYTNRLTENDRNEWIKVQGRFEEIPFVDSSEQTLKLLGKALVQNFQSKDTKIVQKKIEAVVNLLLNEHILPKTMNHDDAIKLFTNCYPLHPVSAALLPLLCQKVAQNERSLFSYLGSREEYGLLSMLERLVKVGDFIYPYHIYDYFISKQSIASNDYITYRRWVEVVNALERVENATLDEINVTKTVGILNIIGAKGNFKASKNILKSCGFPKFSNLAESLQNKSIINYRKFNGEYRVWQGSDFDLSETMQATQESMVNLPIAEELNKQNIVPIVARRYSIEHGTLRYFSPCFIDVHTGLETNLKETTTKERVLFYLAYTKDDEAYFQKKVKNRFPEKDIVVLCPDCSTLSKSVIQVCALKQIYQTDEHLNNDPIARKEVEEYLISAERKKENILRELLDNFESNRWYNNGKKLDIKNKRELQKALSDMLENIYPKTPIIHNELINTDYPSAQAVAARNKLLSAMLEQPSEKDLGIDKFPPEKAMYRALLYMTKIHKKDRQGSYSFTEPLKGQRDKANIYPVWQRINEFLDNTEAEAKSFIELNNELMAAPYGIKAGLLPLIYMAVYVTYKRELAFYHDGYYVPVFTDDHLNRFVKCPHEYTVQRFKIDGLNASIYEQYCTALFNDRKDRTIIELIQPLASFIKQLSLFVQKTKLLIVLTADAIKVRDVFNSSASPEQLLFKSLPKALEVNKKKNKDDFSKRLIEALRSLKYAHNKLLEHYKRLLCEAFNLDVNKSVGDMRIDFAWYKMLADYTIEKDGLKAFINRLAEKNISDEMWLENVLSFLGKLPTKQWTDDTCSIAEFRLSDFSQRTLDLHKLYLAHTKYEKKEIATEIILLKTQKFNSMPCDHSVVIDEKTDKLIQSAKQKLNPILQKYSKSEKLAILAKIADESFRESSDSEKQKEKSIDLGILKEK